MTAPPNWRRRTRPLRHAVAYAALVAVAAALRCLPLGAARALGAALGRVVGAVARGPRRMAAAGLRTVGAADRTGAHFADLGRRLIEATQLRRAVGLVAVPDGAAEALRGDARAGAVPPADRAADAGVPPPDGAAIAPRRTASGASALSDEPLPEGAAGVAPHVRAVGDGDDPTAAARRPGALVLTAHYGNWELLGAALAAAGVPVASVAARGGSGPLFRWLAGARARAGVTTLPPGGGARAAVQRLRGGLPVAVFFDLDTREKARWLSFLGRPTRFSRTAERLRAATGAAPWRAWTVRGADGRYRLDLAPLISADPLAEAAAHLEAAVRADPTQWAWLVDRWAPAPAPDPASRPAGVGDKAAAERPPC